MYKVPTCGITLRVVKRPFFILTNVGLPAANYDNSRCRFKMESKYLIHYALQENALNLQTALNELTLVNYFSSYVN